MPTVSTHLLPRLIGGTSLTNSTCVIIDVLRASTTIIHALGNGALGVIPCRSIEEAVSAADRFPASERVLGGERHGKLIDGFDLDNSPFRYGPENVRDKMVVFTTTNGTRALTECRSASTILIGAFVNLSALVWRLQNQTQDLHLVCAGTDGNLTAEDILFAGAVIRKLLDRPGSNWKSGNVQTDLALDYYSARSRTPELFQQAFTESLGAQNLLELGMDADIDRCQQRDLFECVPLFDAKTGVLHTAV